MNFFLFLIASILVTSCDCLQRGEGIVADAVTHQPLSGVRVHKVNTAYDETMSDSTGYFRVESISGFPECNCMKVEVSLDGYITQVIEIEHPSLDTIFMKR